MSFFCFAFILTRKIELVVVLILPVGCLVTVNVLWLCLTVTWVVLQCVIVVFSDHTHFIMLCRGEHDAIKSIEYLA